jgi:hypothetical protein
MRPFRSLLLRFEQKRNQALRNMRKARSNRRFFHWQKIWMKWSNKLGNFKLD